ncbi:hypothetical protein BQ8420_01055 [Nocardiopsis sp. JB363]|nr:hypothetical protein BQ8420_01055 [Nocardiopsis sp. JB363]
MAPLPQGPQSLSRSSAPRPCAAGSASEPWFPTFDSCGGCLCILSQAAIRRKVHIRPPSHHHAACARDVFAGQMGCECIHKGPTGDASHLRSRVTPP